MGNEELARELGEIRTEIKHLAKNQADHMERVDNAFARGSDRMREIEHRTWKQWVAIIVVAVAGSQAGPWITKALGLPTP